MGYGDRRLGLDIGEDMDALERYLLLAGFIAQFAFWAYLMFTIDDKVKKDEDEYCPPDLAVGDD